MNIKFDTKCTRYRKKVDKICVPHKKFAFFPKLIKKDGMIYFFWMRHYYEVRKFCIFKCGEYDHIPVMRNVRVMCWLTHEEMLIDTIQSGKYDFREESFGAIDKFYKNN